jgi:hypothetical protein
MITTKVKFLAIVFIQILVCSNWMSAQKVRTLKKLPITNIRLDYDKNVPKINNSSIPIGLSVLTETKGLQKTKGYLKGTLRWTNFKIKADSAKISNGVLYIPYYQKPPRKIELTITPKYHPEMEFKDCIWLNEISGLIMKPIIEQSVSPGNVFKVALEANFNNGITQKYSMLTNKILKDLHLKIEILGGAFNNGKLYITEDIDKIQNHSVYLFLRNETNSKIQDSIQVYLDYNKQYNYSTSGFSGLGGFDGFSGTSGSNGSIINLNGSNGANGDNGNDGKDGDIGPDIHVFADAYFDSIIQTSLVYVEVNRNNENVISKYLINPQSGGITIVSRGGDGGKGGDGGDGGDGGKGGDGPERVREWRDSTGTHRIVTKGRGGCGGHGGNGGEGGFGGYGGYGGNISVSYTKAAVSYLSIIHIYSIGGHGGSGGKGGDSGEGGRGGDGDPSGRNGVNGLNGPNGNCGKNGGEGIIEFVEIQQ